MIHFKGLQCTALFSDTTEGYVTPYEPRNYDVIKIKFRTLKGNVRNVDIVINQKSYRMNFFRQEGIFDYYDCNYQLEGENISYYFRVETDQETCFYDQRGVVYDIQSYYWFKIIPGFSTPDWAKGAVMYQIYTDRFYNGDKTNDVLTNEYFYIGDYVIRNEDWYQLPREFGVREFYGGDLSGVLQKLDYLEELGVEVLYFNPLFVSPSNHKYDIQDYDYIDPHFTVIKDDGGELLELGKHENRYATKYRQRVTKKENLEASNVFFANFVSEVHKRGMKVILDGVFNHCGSFNKWIDKERIYEQAEEYEKGAYISKESPYHNYFRFYEGGQWPYNHAYDGWWGHDTLPKLNFENSLSLYQYILSVAKKWVSPPFNADGWRLDVAADLGFSREFNHQFWKDFRTAVKEANPNAIVLAEHYGDPGEWLNGKEWDTIMNYDAFMEPVTWFLTGMQKHSDDFRGDMYGNADAFWGAMKYHSTCLTTPSRMTSMNQLSNHDHSRFLTRTNQKVGRINTLGSKAAEENINPAIMREAIMIQMTWPGAPTIYYGDEVGLCGFTDPDNRRTFPWGNEDAVMLEFHKEIIKLHKESKALRKGSLKEIKSQYQFISYARFTEEEQVLVLINNNSHALDVELSIWEVGIPFTTTLKCRLETNTEGFYRNSKDCIVTDGKTFVTIGANSGMIFTHSN